MKRLLDFQLTIIYQFFRVLDTEINYFGKFETKNSILKKFKVKEKDNKNHEHAFYFFSQRTI